MQEKKDAHVSNAAGEKPVLYVQRRVGSNNLYTWIPKSSSQEPWREHGRGEASCSDSALESRDQSLSSLLPRFTHACQQHGVHPVLHLVERTIPQVLRHARDIAALPVVNSGEEAAELPDLMQERGNELGRGSEDFEYLSMLEVGVHYSPRTL